MRLLIIATCALLSACSQVSIKKNSTAPAATTDLSRKPIELQLLALNDFHGFLNPSNFEEAGVTQGKVQAGGAAFLATKINELSRDKANSLLVGVGDMIGASPLVSALLQDEPAIEALNAMGMRYSSLGNHEFDYGLATLMRLIHGGCPDTGCLQGRDYTGAKFEYLASNVIDAKTGATIVPASAMATIEGVRVGFIGADLTATPSIALAKNVAGLNFIDEAQSINSEVAKLKAQGVRSIVVMVHLGGVFQGKVDPTNCAGIEGPIIAFGNALDPEVDVILSAHSHRSYICNLGTKLLTQGASFGHLLTQVQLQIDRRSGEIIRKSAHHVLIDSTTITPDPTLQALVAQAQDATNAVAQQRVGTLAGSGVTRTSDSVRESDLSRLVGDAQLVAASSPETGSAVIALVNEGGVRTDLPPSPYQGSDPGTPIVYGDIYSVHPFGNEIQVLELTGAELKDALEQPLDGSDHIIASDSLRYSISASAAPGNRVIASSMRLNGQPIKPTDRLRVAINNYLVGGGSGQTHLIGKPIVASAGLDRDALVNYLKAGVLKDYKQMRVTKLQ